MVLQVASTFFFAGLAVILALVIVVYLVAWIYDRASGSGEALLTPAELEERRVASSLVRDAGLAGLLSHEINRVTRHFFEESSYLYAKDPVDNDDVKAQENENEEELRQDETSRKEDDATTSIGIKSGDANGNTEENSYTIENIDDTDVETDVEKGEAADVEAGAEYNAETTVEDETTKGEAVVEELKEEEENNNVEGGLFCVSVSDFPLSKSISHLFQPDDNKENSKQNTDRENPTSDSEHVIKATDQKESLVQDEEGVCPICLCEYDDGEKVIIGSSCAHMYHFECFMQWMEKSHNECPFCRTDMMTSDEFLAAAFEVLGEKRVNKLKHINEETARRLAAWHEQHPRRRIEASPNEQSSSQPAATSTNTTDSTDATVVQQ